MDHKDWMIEIKMGKVLQKLTRQSGMSLKELSKKLNIPYTTLHTWIHNGKPNDVVRLKQIADYFGISISELVFGEESQKDAESEEELFRGVTGVGGKEEDSNLKWVFKVTVEKVST